MVRLADDFRFCNADEALKLRIAAQEDAVGVLHPDEIWNSLHQGAQLSFAVAQVAIGGEAGQAVGKAPADRLEQRLLVLGPNARMAALMQAEHVRLVRPGIDGHAQHRANAVFFRHCWGRSELGRRIEGQRAAGSANGRHRPADIRVHGKVDPRGHRAGIFGTGALHRRSPGGGLRIARIDEPSPVAFEDRKRYAENVAHHLLEIVCLLNRQIDPIHAFEEMQIGLKPSIDVLALGAGAQHRDAERQIAGQLFEQPDLLRGEGVGLRRIDVQSPEGDRAFVPERKGDPGAKALRQHLGAPGGAERICSVVLNASAFSGPKGGPNDAAPFFRVGPGDPLLFE